VVPVHDVPLSRGAYFVQALRLVPEEVGAVLRALLLELLLPSNVPLSPSFISVGWQFYVFQIEDIMIISPLQSVHCWT
jgi:hypothetical protein